MVVVRIWGIVVWISRGTKKRREMEIINMEGGSRGVSVDGVR